MSDIIRMENVIKMVQGNRRALKGVNLCIKENEYVALYGDPGSGKRMLIRLITGMEAPSDGKVVVLEQALHEMNANETAVFRNRNIGVVWQESGFLERLSVFENVSLPLAVQGMPLSKRKKVVAEQLKTLGISQFTHAYPMQLSDYEARIASIARALVTQPKILLFYELTSGLSEKETKQLAGTVNAISKYGCYTVLSFGVNPKNDLYTNRTVLINHGKIQEDRS